MVNVTLKCLTYCRAAYSINLSCSVLYTVFPCRKKSAHSIGSPVEQWVEDGVCNFRVVGSTPMGDQYKNATLQKSLWIRVSAKLLKRLKKCNDIKLYILVMLFTG
jgi:hypothetical protein